MTRKQQLCSHSIPTSTRVTSEPCPYSGEVSTHNEYYTEDTYTDISTSQYKCTQCDLTFNYSGGNYRHNLD